MNGARSTFMRKGYWLTALAAIVLLAASPGTASAQVKITGPDRPEGWRPPPWMRVAEATGRMKPTVTAGQC